MMMLKIKITILMIKIVMMMYVIDVNNCDSGDFMVFLFIPLFHCLQLVLLLKLCLSTQEVWDVGHLYILLVLL